MKNMLLVLVTLMSSMLISAQDINLTTVLDSTSMVCASAAESQQRLADDDRYYGARNEKTVVVNQGANKASSKTNYRKTLPEEGVLEYFDVTPVMVPVDKFIPADYFVVNSKRGAKVLISYMNSRFITFLKESVVEEPVKERLLHYATLRKDTSDAWIVYELGGNEKASVTFSEIYHLLLKQPNGEDGLLLTDGRANMFYVQRRTSVNNRHDYEEAKLCLEVVIVYWRGNGWGIVSGYAPSKDIDRPVDGPLVFSRIP